LEDYLLKSKTDGAPEQFFEKVTLCTDAVMVVNVLLDSAGVLIPYEAERDYPVCAIKYCDVGIVGRPFPIPCAINENDNPLHGALAFRAAA
jgi:hypothetical protein